MLSSLSLSGQDSAKFENNQFIGSLEDYIRLNQTRPAEKVFLHTDRQGYLQSDTIWFKAYLWYGFYQVPDTISRILYVDLLNSAGKIRIQKRLLIQNGTSQGDFTLDTSFRQGSYMLRAYTRRMGNANCGEPYYRPIIINPANQNFQVECTPVIIKQTGNDSLKIAFSFFEIDQLGNLNTNLGHKVSYSLRIGDQLRDTGMIRAINTKEQLINFGLDGASTNDSAALFEISIKDNRVNFKKEFRIPLQDRIDIQFLPEGGSLVKGLESKLAFKAIGTDGLSREVMGEIKDEDDKFITGFESLHKGMGYFLLKPESGKKYFAHIWYNKLKYIIPLPRAVEKGYTMSVGYTGKGENLFLAIKQTPDESKAQKYVIGSAYGKIWFSALVTMVRDTCLFRIPSELLPEGVCRLTVLNGNFKPQCERLVYIDKNERLNIEVKADSSSYKTRSKVSLKIKVSVNNAEPLQTNLSLSVVDNEQMTGIENTGGICTYKLLESELKGYIEDAGFYFKDSCINTGAMDLLMLTQGYRKFLPADTIMDELKFQPEQYFEISGSLKFGLKSLEKRYKYSDIDLSLITFSGNPYIAETKPDSLGWFRYEIPLSYGKNHSILQATTGKKKPFYGSITLNDPAAQPKFVLPALPVNNLSQPAIKYISRLQAYKKTEITKNPAYGLMSLDIPEVTITAKAKNWYLNFEPNAKKIANLDSLDPTGNKYDNIYDLLIREFGAIERNIYSGITTILLPSRGMADFWFPIYLINGQIYLNGGEDGKMLIALFNHIYAINVNEIKRLMVLPPGNIASYYANPFVLSGGIRQSLVVIETYSDTTYRGDPRGIKTFILDGLDAPREFYSPRYDGPMQKSPVYDGRATLYWNPSILTDARGEANVEFFTSDRQTGLEVIINCIELGTGNPGQKRFSILSGKEF